MAYLLNLSFVTQFSIYITDIVIYAQLKNASDASDAY